MRLRSPLRWPPWIQSAAGTLLVSTVRPGCKALRVKDCRVTAVHAGDICPRASALRHVSTKIPGHDSIVIWDKGLQVEQCSL